MKLTKGVLALALGCGLLAEAKVDLALPFADHMVLQREMPVRVWGTADPGEKVSVRFAGQEVAAEADAKGAWRVELTPMEASREGRPLTVVGSATAEPVVVNDVLVGEVWFSSGQSNADVPIWGDWARYRDGRGALVLQKTRRPLVRLVYVKRSFKKNGVKARWRTMTPDLYTDYMKKGERLPSAVGYYYALELFNALDVPIGLVDSSEGGTPIEEWTPRSEYESRPELADVLKKRTSGLWEGMVAPFAPMAIRGFIWYQGCANRWSPKLYAEKMHALYDGWAKAFANPNLKLYYAQLAPYQQQTLGIQLEQARFEREEKNAAMIVLSDAGNIHDIHPNDKQTVAERLALHALRRDYGFELRDNSPTLREWRIEGDAFVMTFNDADGWFAYSDKPAGAKGFEIAGEDGVYKPAEVRNYMMVPDKKDPSGKSVRYLIHENKLVVSAEGVKEPKRLRYLFTAPWKGTLYNESCLPLGPFEIK